MNRLADFLLAAGLVIGLGFISWSAIDIVVRLAG